MKTLQKFVYVLDWTFESGFVNQVMFLRREHFILNCQINMIVMPKLF